MSIQEVFDFISIRIQPLKDYSVSSTIDSTFLNTWMTGLVEVECTPRIHLECQNHSGDPSMLRCRGFDRHSHHNDQVLSPRNDQCDWMHQLVPLHLVEPTILWRNILDYDVFLYMKKFEYINSYLSVEMSKLFICKCTLLRCDAFSREKITKVFLENR